MSTLQTLNNGESLGTIRGKVNSNFTTLNADKLEASQVLLKTNTVTYTPTTDYHPATKLYVDQKQTTWAAIYDPTSVNADVFARANHTGTQAPATVATDSNNRFITDAERIDWNQKEDDIGTKGTAFNKAFGTGSGTVAEGDHTHTKSDISLGNVDNTSDVNKPVSTLQQAALDDKVDLTPDYIDLVEQVSHPSYVEGRIFYDTHHKGLAVFSDISDVTLNVGQEMWMRVINKTGSAITNGQVCRHAGVDGTTELPKIQLAIATSLEGSRILGVATHEIADGDEGFITTFGKVGDINTSGLSLNVPIFLSDTVAGGMTTTAPDLRVQVGGALAIGTVADFMVSILNLSALTSLLGILDTIAGTYVLTTSWDNLDGYTNDNDIGMSINATTGKITIPATGWYRTTFTTNISLAASPSDDVVLFQLYNETTTDVEMSTSITCAGTTGSRSATKHFYATVGDVVVMQTKSDDTTTTMTIVDVSFDLQSISVES